MINDEQCEMFGETFKKVESDSIYAKTTAKNLIYEPSPHCPHPAELVDRCKAVKLQNQIKSSSVSDDEKRFLQFSAQRHNGFNYDKIADYYAHASSEMQELMEASGLVIVDFDKAIENGFVALSDAICKQYSEEKNEG